MRVLCGVTVSGEMFRTPQNPAAAQPPLKRLRQISDHFRLLTPRPHIDHGVGRVAVDVTDRAQHPVEAATFGLLSRDPSIAFGQSHDVVGIFRLQPPQRHGGHEPGGAFKPLAHAFLHIGAQQEL